VSVIVPENWLRKVRAIVEVADVLAVTVAGRVAETLKSVNLKTVLVVCDNGPLVPVTVRV